MAPAGEPLRARTRRRVSPLAALVCFVVSFGLGFGGGALARRAQRESDDDDTARAKGVESRPSSPGVGRPSRERRLEAEKRFQAGFTHLQAERYSQALLEFERAAEADPTDPRPHHGSGKVYQAMFLPQRAEASFRKALRADPDFLESRKQLATVLHDGGKFHEAVELLEPVARRYPQDNFIRGELAINLLRIGETQRAVELLEAFIRADGQSAWGHTNLGNAYEEAGRTKEAEREYRAALRIDSSSSVTYFRLGNLLAADGRKGEAEPLLERYRQLRALGNDAHQLKMNLLRQPDHVPTLVRLAEVQYRLGRKADAVATLQRARALAPGDRKLDELHAKVRAELERERR